MPKNNEWYRIPIIESQFLLRKIDHSRDDVDLTDPHCYCILQKDRLSTFGDALMLAGPCRYQTITKGELWKEKIFILDNARYQIRIVNLSSWKRG